MMGGLGGILLLSLLGASISGVIVATIAKILLPGKQRVSGVELFLIGTGAAWLGGFIAGLIGLGTDRRFGIDDIGALAIQVIIAAIAIYFWTNFRNKQVKQAIVPGPPRGKDKKDKDDKDKKDKDKKGTGIPGPL
jgi:hypothetical protein